MPPSTRASSAKLLARSRSSSLPLTPPAPKRSKKKQEPASETSPLLKAQQLLVSAPDEPSTPSAVVPAVLPFSFQEAKTHLSNQDPRFKMMFERFRCKPYEEPGEEDCFMNLVLILIGQQISVHAARSIRNRFIKLFYPDEVLDELVPRRFPSPSQILALPAPQIDALKTAGLSTRKAEYILDLANRFQIGGELSGQTLLKASDEDIKKTLIAIRGIGPWTVDMFTIFTMKRPDILPCGDLGVQKGLLKWVLDGQTGSFPSPLSLPHNFTKEPTMTPASKPSTVLTALPPTPITPSTIHTSTPSSLPLPPSFRTPSAVSFAKPPAIDQPPTPSPDLPEGLTLAMLKSRLGGQKAKGGLYLTPKEMDELTESWKPFRSVGCWVMWKYLENEPAV